ncbi:unnamed protein product [Strongylus vulgaris]|uniref:Uncharacterized protein n=1 Tax=Strongylus vulgaris TaxID=40348 RepID=A0A3P7IWF6_STRVU|nr:unnamed protein product [Strongylus vulgaris]
MWWAGDVRDYWMALTILEIIAVFINVYCVVVVYMFLKRLTATTDQYEGKDPRSMDFTFLAGGVRLAYDIRRTTPEKIMKNSYPHYTTPMRQSFPAYAPSEIPQTPMPMPPSRRTPVPPYPLDDQEVCLVGSDPIYWRLYHQRRISIHSIIITS